MILSTNKYAILDNVRMMCEQIIKSIKSILHKVPVASMVGRVDLQFFLEVLL